MTTVVVALVSASIATVIAALVMRAVMVGRSETERAELERSVRESESAIVVARSRAQRLQGAIDSIDDAVLVIARDGTVLDRNVAAEAFIEARHADALVRAAVAELVELALEVGSGTRTLELFGPPRRTVTVAATSVPSESGQVVVAMVRDISAMRRLESVRTDFVANVSHELRTPAGAMSLLAETLVDEHDPATIERLANRILSESRRLSETLDDLLDLSRIESGDSVERVEVDLAGLLDEVIERTRITATARGCVVEIRAVDPGLALVCDRRQVLSAITNLVDNALKYSDPDCRVELGAVRDADDVVISVADQGIGIPARDLDRVFERFYRVDQARSRTTGGTGLGLSIVRHVVENHGGSVEIESRLGEGSTFRLRLPTHGASAVPTRNVAGAVEGLIEGIVES